jgi:Ca-activated chloride channel family protein
VQADYILDYNVISVAQEHHVYLLARIKAGPTVDLVERLPLNLSVVLDRSGSMAGDKLDYVKKAVQFLVQHLGADDRFSVVIYSEVVQVSVSPRPVIHKDSINHTVGEITAGGMTNLSGGWLQGCQLVSEGQAEGQVNRVLLLTDGLANQGVTDPKRLAAIARKKREGGITTTTLGVGMDFNEDLLVRMAHEGGGAFYFIDNPDQAPLIFAEELQDLLSVVGQNLVITLTLSEDVRMIRQLNTYPSETKNREVVFRLGDLFSDEIKTLLIELSIPALDELGEVEVARLRFDYDELSEDQAVHRAHEIPIIVNAVPADELEAQTPDAEVVKTALLLRAARAREEAIEHADQGRFEDAQEALSSVADDIQESGLEDEELQTEHDMLREEAVDMEMGARRYDAYARKTGTSKVFHANRHAARATTTATLHLHMKSSREALERDGETPEVIAWKRESLDLASVDEVRIGRADDNDIVIEEGEVSNYHCRIVRRGDDLLLEDLGSTNGTFANGGLVETPFRLSVGDVVTVGSWLFMFKASD